MIAYPHSQRSRGQAVAALQDEGTVKALRQANDLQQHEKQDGEGGDGEGDDTDALEIAAAASRMVTDHPPGTSASITAACVASDTQAPRR